MRRRVVRASHGSPTVAAAAASAEPCGISGSPGGSSASAGGSAASADCAGTGAHGGADLQIPDVEEGKFNVAMVLIGPHDDGGWSQAHYEGLQYLCENVPDTHVAYIELVPEGADSEQVFRSLARKGFNFIIGTSFGYMDPMATVAEEFPDIDLPAPDRLQVERQELRQLLRRDGGLQVPRRHARRVARQEGRQPEDRLHGDLPDPGGAPPRQRDHARRQGDLPRVHDGRPLHQHLARPGQGADGAASLFDAGAQVVFTGADTPAVADVAQEKGKWARHLRPPELVQGRRAA